MNNTINVIASRPNRYADVMFSRPISSARYTTFMKQAETLISKLNTLLINEYKNIFEVIYGIIAQNINQDFLKLHELAKEEIKEIVERALVYSLTELSIPDGDSLESDVESIFSEYGKLVNFAKGLLDVDSRYSITSKLRGIMMEVLAISIFGKPKDFKDDSFVWDFNVIHNNSKVRFSSRETADIYYKNSIRHYIGEVKCRPSGIDESQLDFINHVCYLFEGDQTDKLILHGSTSENYDIEKIEYKDKLKEFAVYPTDRISNLIGKLQY